MPISAFITRLLLWLLLALALLLILPSVPIVSAHAAALWRRFRAWELRAQADDMLMDAERYRHAADDAAETAVYLQCRAREKQAQADALSPPLARIRRAGF